MQSGMVFRSCDETIKDRVIDEEARPGGDSRCQFVDVDQEKDRSTDARGTPERTGVQLDLAPSTTTACLRLVRELEIHWLKVFLTP